MSGWSISFFFLAFYEFLFGVLLLLLTLLFKEFDSLPLSDVDDYLLKPWTELFFSTFFVGKFVLELARGEFLYGSIASRRISPPISMLLLIRLDRWPCGDLAVPEPCEFSDIIDFYIGYREWIDASMIEFDFSGYRILLNGSSPLKLPSLVV